MTLRVLDLFSGIGGFSLGLESAGAFTTAAFCESNPYARRVLAKQWPKVKRYHDVRTLTGARLAADGIAADVVAGGFPCQDISVAGAGRGLEGERSGLWREMRRIVGEVRPRWVIAENVPRLRVLGADQVLADLEALGYSVWPCVVGAIHAGAPHLRKRVWIIAHADSGSSFRGDAVAGNGRAIPTQEQVRLFRGGDVGQAVPLAEHGGSEMWNPQGHWSDAVVSSGWWSAEPSVGRVAYGVPDRVDRLQCLGNAVVPGIVREIGLAILTVEAELAKEAA